MTQFKKYKHVFFDLDRTLWDLEKNAFEALQELHEHFNLAANFSLQEFATTYRVTNEKYWKMYRDGKIGKEKLRGIRFLKTLEQLGFANESLAEELGEKYLEIMPTKSKLIAGSKALLDYLQPKYTLHVITNGFEEVQHRKLKMSQINNYFVEIITSERAGAKKPNPKIFSYAFEQVNAASQECILIGDDYEADVLGARAVGMDQIFFNANGNSLNNAVKPTYQVDNLKAIKALL